MLQDEKTRLNIRYTRLEDASALTEWFQEDEILNWFPIVKVQLDIDSAVNFWLGHSKLNSSLTAEIDGHPCGLATLFLQPYTKVSHQSEIGIIVNKGWRGKGVGSILLNNLELLAKNRFNLEFLHLQVYAENPAISLYKRLGFIEFGRHEYWIKEKNGQYRACLFMSCKIPFKIIPSRFFDNFAVEKEW